MMKIGIKVVSLLICSYTLFTIIFAEVEPNKPYLITSVASGHALRRDLSYEDYLWVGELEYISTLVFRYGPSNAIWNNYGGRNLYLNYNARMLSTSLPNSQFEWKFDEIHIGKYFIRSLYNNLCLTNGGKASVVSVKTCNPNNNLQLWFVSPTPDS